MDSTTLGSILAVGTAAGGGLWQYLRSRPREKAKSAAEARAEIARDRAADAKLNSDRYDQLQEDLVEERRARIADNERTNRELVRALQINSVQAAELRVTGDYASELRQWIEDRKPPPPPAWPVSLTKGASQ